MAEQNNIDITLRVKDLATRALKGVGDSVGKLGTSVNTFGAKIRKLDIDFNNLSRKSALMATAIVGAVGAAAVEYSNVGDEVAKFAAKTGLAVESVSALRVAAGSA